MANNLIRGSDLFTGWKRAILSGKRPVQWALADDSSPLSSIQAGPGRVTVLGGLPGGGKTALAMQLITDALRLAEDLRVLVANVEMPPNELLNRQLSRLSGIDLKTVQDRSFSPDHEERLQHGFTQIESIIERLGFVKGPFSFENVADAADEMEPQIFVLDYLQRFTTTALEDRRGGIDQSMNCIRQFAEAGAFVLVISALARQKDSKGRTGYKAESLGLSSFRDSSEIEFGVDDAYILAADKDPAQPTLMHLKSRNGECRHIALKFDGAVQRFGGCVITDASSQAKSWWQK